MAIADVVVRSGATTAGGTPDGDPLQGEAIAFPYPIMDKDRGWVIDADRFWFKGVSSTAGGRSLPR